MYNPFNVTENRRDLMMVPLQSWEILQLATYFK